MSIRAIILGLLLGGFVSAATYFNDKVINQTMLIGNHFPIAVFGVAVILLLLVNPLLRAIGRGLPLRGGEIAIIVALGLAACGWPGSGYFRGFDTIVALPQHWYKTKANWQANNVFSYTPGAAAELAPGHVQDWPGFVRALKPGPEGGDGAGAVLRDALSPEAVRDLARVDPSRPMSANERDRLLRPINQSLITRTGEDALYARLLAAGLLPEPAAAELAERDALLAEAQELEARREALIAEREAVEAQLAPEVERLRDAQLRLQAEMQAASDPAARAAVEDRLAALRAEILAAQEPVAQLQRAIDNLSGELNYVRSEAEHRERHANRAALAALLPGVVLPAPEGHSLLAASGRPDPWAVDLLMQGQPSEPWGLGELPWRAWVSPMALWWTFALLLGVSALCLALIVHPQWSRRELLPYPIARFVEEAAEREHGAWLPTVARSKMFWFAFGSLLLIHSVNGLHAWFDQVPEIPLRFNFSPARQLFPTASRDPASGSYLQPRVFLSVIAFAFFLTTSVSFSLGISQALYLALFSLLVSQGMTLEKEYAGAKPYNMLVFGAYVGVALMVIYTGRRYYANVAGSALGLARGPETPPYATWAARGLGLAAVAAVVVVKSAGLDWFLAAAFVLLALLIFLVMSRIVVETGAFFMQANWLPVGVLTGLFGFDAIGPTAYIILGVASMLNVVDPREALMPYLANGLQMADRTAQVRPARVAPWLLVMLVGGFFVAGVTTIYLQYRYGLSSVEGWTTMALPEMTFDNVARYTAEAAARDTLASATAVTPLERFGEARPMPGAILWLGIGLTLVLITAVARLRLAWWPLHPIAFLVWGTYPMNQFAFSFLLGWLIKAAVMRTTGAKGYHSVKPMMIGIIAGELFAGLLWMAIGATYFFVSGKTPVRYVIFPG